MSVSTVSAPDSLKMIRETLCVAQQRVSRVIDSRSREHMARIGRLIDDIDRQRPLGPDGKHGDQHTPDCGCEEVMRVESQEASGQTVELAEVPGMVIVRCHCGATLGVSDPDTQLIHHADSGHTVIYPTEHDGGYEREPY